MFDRHEMGMTERPIGPTASLHYREGGLPVHVGDKIIYRGLLPWRRWNGSVVYVPGQCPPHPELTDEYWGIELVDGRLLVWPYMPAELPVTKRLSFVSRGIGDESKGLPPDRPLGLDGGGKDKS